MHTCYFRKSYVVHHIVAEYTSGYFLESPKRVMLCWSQSYHVSCTVVWWHHCSVHGHSWWIPICHHSWDADLNYETLRRCSVVPLTPSIIWTIRSPTFSATWIPHRGYINATMHEILSELDKSSMQCFTNASATPVKQQWIRFNSPKVSIWYYHSNPRMLHISRKHVKYIPL